MGMDLVSVDGGVISMSKSSWRGVQSLLADLGMDVSAWTEGNDGDLVESETANDWGEAIRRAVDTEDLVLEEVTARGSDFSSTFIRTPRAQRSRPALPCPDDYAWNQSPDLMGFSDATCARRATSSTSLISRPILYQPDCQEPWHATVDLAVDIHHVFPQKWCNENAIDDEHRESIVNKTAISARTNRTIGGAALSSYLEVIESRAQVEPDHLDELLATHQVPSEHLRSDDFDAYFAARREALCTLVEDAIGKPVQRDVALGNLQEDSAQFEPEGLAEVEEPEAGGL